MLLVIEDVTAEDVAVSRDTGTVTVMNVVKVDTCSGSEAVTRRGGCAEVDVVATVRVLLDVVELVTVELDVDM